MKGSLQETYLAGARRPANAAKLLGDSKEVEKAGPDL